MSSVGALVTALVAVALLALPTLPVFAIEVSASAPPEAPIFRAVVVSPALEQDFRQKSFKRDLRSGNFLSPKVASKTYDETLVPIHIGGSYSKDLRGNAVFVRETIRTRLLQADAAMFAAKRQHIKVNYGFRANPLQQELFKQLSGKSPVAPPGMSFHETGMALDISNWRDAQRFLIDAGFVGGCYGIEEDFVHYSINELTKGSNVEAFKRCSLREIPEHIMRGLKTTSEGLKKKGESLRGRFKRKE